MSKTKTISKTVNRLVSPAQIRRSDLQPRKHFASDGIAELVTSFSEHGFDEGLSRLLVRPVNEVRIEHDEDSEHWYVQSREHGAGSNGKSEQSAWETIGTAESDEKAKSLAQSLERFELVCGERRWRAANELGLKQVPIAVQNLDDLHTLQKQLIENLDRKSLTAMEEALAYKRLIEMGQTQEEIAQSIGQARTHVKERLALCRLFGTPVAEAIESGAITHSHGFELSQVPSPALRLELLGKILNPPDGSQAPWGVMALRAHIDLDYQAALKTAIFDKDDVDLVPVEIVDGERKWGGACTDCPFNVGRQMCTNMECFRMKEIADFARWASEEVESRKSKGKNASTLTHQENEALWGDSGVSLVYHSPYVELTALPDASELKSGVDCSYQWRAMIEDQNVPIILGRDANGDVHELARHDLAKRAAHLNGFVIFRDSPREVALDQEPSATTEVQSSKSEDSAKEETLSEKKKREAAVAARNAKIERIVKAAEARVRRGMLQPPKIFWQAAMLSLLDALNSAKLLIDLKSRRGGPEGKDDALNEATKLPLGAQFGLVVESLILLTGDAEQWAKVFGVKPIRAKSATNAKGAKKA